MGQFSMFSRCDDFDIDDDDDDKKDNVIMMVAFGYHTLSFTTKFSFVVIGQN